MGGDERRVSRRRHRPSLARRLDAVLERDREASRREERRGDAAKRAFCDEFIRQKPQGYDTRLDGLGGELVGTFPGSSASAETMSFVLLVGLVAGAWVVVRAE